MRAPDGVQKRFFEPRCPDSSNCPCSGDLARQTSPNRTGPDDITHHYESPEPSVRIDRVSGPRHDIDNRGVVPRTEEPRARTLVLRTLSALGKISSQRKT